MRAVIPSASSLDIRLRDTRETYLFVYPYSCDALPISSSLLLTIHLGERASPRLAAVHDRYAERVGLGLKTISDNSGESGLLSTFEERRISIIQLWFLSAPFAIPIPIPVLSS